LGIRASLEKHLGVKIYVPEKPQFVVATGAALVARDSLGK
jgi:activator of 2-hydroxyglutaryl-CoA dehydratase